MIKLKPLVLAISIAAVIFGGIGISALIGYWNTESTKNPAKFSSGDFEGLPNPSDIRGSYSWNDVSEAFGIPAKSLLKAFGVSDPAARVSDLELIYDGIPEGYEIGTDSVKLFVSLYTGLPHESEGTTLLPASAIDVLRLEGKGDKAAIEAAASKAYTSGPSSKPSAAPEEEKTVSGKTTFGELKAWNVAEDSIREALGGSIGSDGESIKTWCEANGISFSEAKEKLQALIP